MQKPSESTDGTTLKVEFKAGKIPQEEIEHALANEKNHVRKANKVYLLTKELKDKATQLQKRITGDLDTPLLSQFSYTIEKYKFASIEEIILSADPLFKPPKEWKKKELCT